MRVVCRTRLLTLSCSLALIFASIAPSAARSAPKPRGTPGPIAPRPVQTVAAGEGTAGIPACEMGQSGPATDTLNFIYPPDDYYTLLTTRACAQCASANTVRFSRVQLMLYFPVVCNFPVTVAVVGAGGTPDCPTPNVTNVLFQGGAFDLIAETPDTLIAFTLTMPETCQFTGNAFLRLGFPVNGTGCAGIALQPRAVFFDRNACTSCRSYNDIDLDDQAIQDDMCTPDRIGNPVMGVLVDRCFDSIAPGTVSDLQQDSVSASAVRLVWHAPGDDGPDGSAASYELRRATFPLDATNFTSGDSIADLPAPAAGGATQSFLVTGLANTQPYYFGLRARDEEGNLGGISNILGVTTGAAPGQVVDLEAVDATEASVTLRWTAPGSTAEAGLPEDYLVRAATQPLTVASFETAPLARVMAATAATGEIETYRFEGLDPARHYWFALRARDGNGNLSPLSNLGDHWTWVGGPLTGQRGAALSSRFTPARVPVQLFWQAVSQDVTTEQVLRIYDMNGRWIRSYYLGTGFGGITAWDGLDYQGRTVPAGLYFARLISSGVRAHARIVLVR